MAGDKREVRVAVVGDAAQLQRELLKAEGQLSGFGNNAKKSGDILRTALFGGAVLYGAQKLVKAAGDLEQSIGGTAAVFEQASGPINDFAKNAADLVGLSENAARSLTSRLGASLKGAGLSAEEAANQSVFLTKTGADLAATLGGNTNDAVSALGSALRGEFDPLERFGIALKASEISAKAVSMGLAESESSVSAYAKGQATLALITERSAFAQGQFGREADTAQGQQQRAAAAMEDASARLGKSLLPIYTKIQETVVLVAEAFAMLPGPVQTGLIGLTGIVLIGPKLVEGFTLAASAAKTAGTAILDTAAKAVTTQSAVAGMNIATQGAGAGAAAAAGGMSLLGPAALAVGAAAVIGGLAWKSYSDEQAAVKKDIDALKKTFNELDGSMTENTRTTVAAILQSKNQIDNLNKAGVSVAQFSDVIDDNRDALVKQGDVEAALRMQMEYGTEAAQDRIDAIREAGGTQNELIARLLESESADMGLIETLYNGIDAYNQQQEVIRQLNIQKGIAAGKTEAQATAEADLAAASKTASEALEKQLKVTIDLRDAQITEEEAQIKNRKALEDYTTSLKDGSLSADERKQAELDLETTYRASVKAAVDAAEAQATLEGKTLTAGESAAIQSQKYKDLAGTLAPDSPLRKRLEQLSFELFLLSLNQPEVRIRLETEAATRKFKEFLVSLGIPEGGQVDLGAILSYSSGYVEPQKRAGGGPVGAGRPYLVGEKGPELFVPSGYGRIMDAFSTSKALVANAGGGMTGGGGNVTINVSVAPTADKAAIGQTIVEAISSYERRSGPGWRS
jgi:hypothetical protein